MSHKVMRVLREKELPPYVGLHRSAIREAIKNGEFPKPIPLNDSGRAKAWLESEIAVWQAGRIAKRDAT